jgi:hypothetical protein
MAARLGFLGHAGGEVTASWQACRRPFDLARSLRSPVVEDTGRSPELSRATSKTVVPLVCLCSAASARSVPVDAFAEGAEQRVD